MFLLPGLPGCLLRRPRLPADGVAPEAVGTAAGSPPLAVGNPHRNNKPMTRGMLGRRRAITILGAFAGMPLLATDRHAADPAVLYQWTGTALGSPARMMLYHPRQV